MLAGYAGAPSCGAVCDAVGAALGAGAEVPADAAEASAGALTAPRFVSFLNTWTP
jgi:hypothetical protein